MPTIGPNHKHFLFRRWPSAELREGAVGHDALLVHLEALQLPLAGREGGVFGEVVGAKALCRRIRR